MTINHRWHVQKFGQIMLNRKAVQMVTMDAKNLDNFITIKEQDSSHPKEKITVYKIKIRETVFIRREEKWFLQLQHILFKPSWPWQMKYCLIWGTHQTIDIQHPAQD